MDELQEIFDQINERLNKSNTVREEILSLSRRAIQKSSIAIKTYIVEILNQQKCFFWKIKSLLLK